MDSAGQASPIYTSGDLIEADGAPNGPRAFDFGFRYSWKEAASELRAVLIKIKFNWNNSDIACLRMFFSSSPE